MSVIIFLKQKEKNKKEHLTQLWCGRCEPGGPVSLSDAWTRVLLFWRVSGRKKIARNEYMEKMGGQKGGIRNWNL